MKHLLTATLLLIASNAQAEESNLRTITEQFQDWKMVCVEKEAKKQCRINQVLVNQNGNTLAIINVVQKDNDKHLIEIVLPLMLELKQQVNIVLDQKKPLKYAYNFCNNTACFVIANEDEKLLAAFKQATLGSLGVTPVGKEELQFNFSLKGFSAALSSLDNNL